MLHIIPLTEDNVELRTHVMTTSEYNRFRGSKETVWFNRKGVNVKRMLQGKCPVKSSYKKTINE